MLTWGTTLSRHGLAVSRPPTDPTALTFAARANGRAGLRNRRRNPVAGLLLAGLLGMGAGCTSVPGRNVPRPSDPSSPEAACRVGYTTSTYLFRQMLDECGEGRVNMVAIGDSWFAFTDGNLLFPLRVAMQRSRARPASNLLNLAQPGNDASTAVSGVIKRDFADVLRYRDYEVRFILPSGGGNDVLGRNDIDRLLRQPVPPEDPSAAETYFDQPTLERKLEGIRIAYEEILDMRETWAPEAIVVTHTYARVKPSGRPASVEVASFDVEVDGPWIAPFLREKGIVDERIQQEVMDYLLGRVNETIRNVLSSHRGGLAPIVIVDTRNTVPPLEPGNPEHWQDEIHPTPMGFDILGHHLIRCMQLVSPDFLRDVRPEHGDPRLCLVIGPDVPPGPRG